MGWVGKENKGKSTRPLPPTEAHSLEAVQFPLAPCPRRQAGSWLGEGAGPRRQTHTHPRRGKRSGHGRRVPRPEGRRQTDASSRPVVLHGCSRLASPRPLPTASPTATRNILPPRAGAQPRLHHRGRVTASRGRWMRRARPERPGSLRRRKAGPGGSGGLSLTHEDAHLLLAEET